MCISFAYEGAKVAGVFNKITFVHNGFKHRYANVIKKNFLTFDYLPTYMANEIDQSSGLFKPQRHKKSSKKKIAEDNLDLLNVHWNLESYVQETKDDNQDVLLDYIAFYNNLIKFHNMVPSHMRTRPMYKFLSFILNDRHKNTTILSHFCRRFDILLRLEMALTMQLTFMLCLKDKALFR